MTGPPVANYPSAMPDAEPVPHIDRAVTSVTRWTGGVTFTIGLLGLLRRHFDGFLSAPGAAVLGLTTTPLGHSILVFVGLAGIFAVRAQASAARYLRRAGALLVVLAIVGVLAGGASGDGLAMNARASLVLGVLGAIAGVTGLISGRRDRRTDELS